MPEDALVNGQVGQPASPEPQGGTVTEQGGTVLNSGQSVPESEQPLTLTKGQLDQIIADAFESRKQNWLDEAYQNTQSMNDKYEKRLNDTIAMFEQVGMKNVDKVTAAKFLREQDKRNAAENVPAQGQGQQQIDPVYAQFLQRFGAQNAGDPGLQGAYNLERDFGIQLLRDDPEYTEFFGDPQKRWRDTYAFIRDYERALEKKKGRSADTQQANGNIAAIPSISGAGRKSSAIDNKAKATDIISQGLAEMNNKR